jgi:hypothetical protein
MQLYILRPHTTNVCTSSSLELSQIASHIAMRAPSLSNAPISSGVFSVSFE